jgi:hypothetical protein
MFLKSIVDVERIVDENEKKFRKNAATLDRLESMMFN